MARRILPADAALTPQTQSSLEQPRRPEVTDGMLARLEARWRELHKHTEPFDWDDREALMAEIDFVNSAQAVLDEAAVKIAPSVLRIALTVQRNIPDQKAQRAFLEEHLNLDFRRVSELCIVARSYMLLDPDPARREAGAAEIDRYGWSKALKLAHVPDPADRAQIWDNARGDAPSASYRAVLEELRRFRERKLVNAPDDPDRFETRVESTRRLLGQLTQRLAHLDSRDDYAGALDELQRTQRELNRLKKALQEQLSDADVEALAAEA